MDTSICTMATEMAQSAFGQFILSEMERRKMSERAFADFVGVTHKTLGKFINSVEPGYPSVALLIKLAEATHTDICYLIALVAPDVSKKTAISPNALIIGQRIDQLPENVQQAIDGIIAKFASE